VAINKFLIDRDPIYQTNMMAKNRPKIGAKK
jgi:hypothetical protein